MGHTNTKINLQFFRTFATPRTREKRARPGRSRNPPPRGEERVGSSSIVVFVAPVQAGQFVAGRRDDGTGGSGNAGVMMMMMVA